LLNKTKKRKKNKNREKEEEERIKWAPRSWLIRSIGFALFASVVLRCLFVQFIYTIYILFTPLRAIFSVQFLFANL